MFKFKVKVVCSGSVVHDLGIMEGENSDAVEDKALALAEKNGWDVFGIMTVKER